MDKATEFKKELQALLEKYNAEIYGDSQGEGFTTVVVIDIDNKEVMRSSHNCISQYDIK